MKNLTKKIVASVAVVGIGFGLTGCNDAATDRQRAQNEARADAKRDTLEKENLKKKRDLEESPDRVTYVYLLSFGKPYGYFVAKGKISSSGSQLGPEQDWIPNSGGVVVDSAKDDGSYGSGDPGIFFWTANGTMVETNSEFFTSTQPIATDLDLPKLG